MNVNEACEALREASNLPETIRRQELQSRIVYALTLSLLSAIFILVLL